MEAAAVQAHKGGYNAWALSLLPWLGYMHTVLVIQAPNIFKPYMDYLIPQIDS